MCTNVYVLAHFTAATRHNTSCSEDEISYECRSSGRKEQIKEIKIVDTVLLSLFTCSNVMVQHCQRPPPSTGFSGTLFSTRLRMSPMIPNDQKIYYLHYDDVRGDVLWPPHGTTPATVKIKAFLLRSMT